MRADALVPYEDALRAHGPLALRTAAGELVPLDLSRWLAAPDDVDHLVVDRCAGPVLDVGCGPGRFVAALGERGVAALGVDIAATAVALTRGQGLPALWRDVFAQLPGEGRWPTVLLMDGNVGIGGDPQRLLGRIRRLLAAGGQLLVETDADATAHALLDVQFTAADGPVGPVFGWALLGRDALENYARGCGYSVLDSWSAGGRCFSVLAA